jgi:single-strand DNA-binding protein
MGKGLNKVYLLGNLGDEPQLKRTTGGTPYVRFRLATSERFKTKDDEWKDHTEWHMVVLWGNRAEGLAKIMRKGSQVMVEGTLRTTSYVKEGVTRFSTEIRAHDVCLASSSSKWAPAETTSTPVTPPLAESTNHEWQPGADTSDGASTQALLPT